MGDGPKYLVELLSGPLWGWALLWCASFALFGIAAFRNANLVWGLLLSILVYGTALPIQRGEASDSVFDWIFFVSVFVGIFIYLRSLGRRGRRQREMRREKMPEG